MATLDGVCKAANGLFCSLLQGGGVAGTGSTAFRVSKTPQFGDIATTGSVAGLVKVKPLWKEKKKSKKSQKNNKKNS